MAKSSNNKMIWGIIAVVAVVAVIFGLRGGGPVQEADSCKTLRVVDVGWSDNTAINALTFTVAEALGYDIDTKVLSNPVSAKSLSLGDRDIFLDLWSASKPIYEPYLNDGSVEIVRVNLEGAKYTFATTKTAYDAGLKNISDIAKFRDELGGRVYGIEPGNEGNDNFREAFKTYGLDGFTVVESSEAGMLTQVDKNQDGFVVFLGWAPHWMNFLYDMEYLDGGDEWFGENGGENYVSTVVRAGYGDECPNVYKFLENVGFTLPMENEVMFKIGKEKKDPRQSALEYLQANPDVVDSWLKGVATADGSKDMGPVMEALGM